MSKYDKDLSKVVDLLEESKEDTKEWRKGIEDRLEKMEKKIYVWKTYLNVGKGLATLLLLIITLKFGNIGTLIKGIF